MALPTTDAIVIWPGDFGDPGLGTQPFSTLAGQRIAINPADASPAFAAARDAMHANGGTAWVAPGTAKYVFSSQVDLGTKPMEWRFSPGATFGYASGVAGLFLIQRPTRFIGLHVVQDVLATPSGQSILLVNDTAASNVAVDCEFVRCKFSLRPTAAAIRDLACIRAEGFGAADTSGRLVLDLCAMELRSGGTQQSWSWVGEETSGAGTNEVTGTPYGLGLLSAKKFRQVLVKSAAIRGQTQGGAGQYAGVPVVLEDCLYADLSGLTVSDVSLASVGSQGVGLVARGVLNEGCHMNLRGGTWSRVTAAAIAALYKPQWFLAQGVVARDIPGALSMFRAFGSGDTVVLKSNLAHKVGGALGVFCEVEDAGSVVATGNLIMDRQNDLNPFALTGCKNVHVRDNLVETRR